MVNGAATVKDADMMHLFGFAMGTPLQGGALVVLILIFGAIIRAIITTSPERKRVANEGKAQERSDAATIRAEFAELNKENRRDIHKLKNDLAVALANQAKSDKEYAADRREYDRQLMLAASVQRESESMMEHLTFCIQCLLDEVKRLDPDPEHNRSIQQAEAVLLHMQKKKEKALPPVSLPDPKKSKALNTAEGAVDDAEATLASTQETCREVQKSEKKK